ncbi:30S ribosomal protein S9 [Candidatus Peregrinibacteria bacterium]|nr:30S ribosomal protein S9 [Candidatus Peregrinibacteria bacterium]
MAQVSKQNEKLRKYYYANGKRKTAICRVRMHENGTGVITINEKPIEKYFTVKTDLDAIYSPLKMTHKLKMFDISIIALGGGIHAQAQAARHGIAKALLEVDETVRTTLKRAGFLTRDARMKERKKYGLKRARRAPQWQKR